MRRSDKLKTLKCKIVQGGGGDEAVMMALVVSHADVNIFTNLYIRLFISTIDEMKSH